MSEDAVVFLVHVPELRNYKGEAREALMALAWTLANKLITKGEYSQVKQIGIGLRGVLQYGGVAVGNVGEIPMTTLAEKVSPKPLIKLLAPRESASGQTAPPK